ncbi:Endocytosis and vacuole integrity protein [Pleurotus ostreatus]|nr:Endocytosis and vacuole integrity protein [Pleurotus ostreatus]
MFRPPLPHVFGLLQRSVLPFPRAREEELLDILRKLLDLSLWPSSPWAAFAEDPTPCSTETPPIDTTLPPSELVADAVKARSSSSSADTANVKDTATPGKVSFATAALCALAITIICHTIASSPFFACPYVVFKGNHGEPVKETFDQQVGHFLSDSRTLKGEGQPDQSDAAAGKWDHSR